MLFSTALILAILVVVKLYFIVVLICISQMTSDVKHLFPELICRHLANLEKWLLKSFFFLLFRTTLVAYEVPRLRVKSELQLLAYTIATATWNLSRLCYLHHSSQQRWIPNTLSEARDQTHIPMDTSWIGFRCTTTGTPSSPFSNWIFCCCWVVVVLYISRY